MAVNGKSKGNRVELALAKMLTEHFSYREEKPVFKRAPMSGGFGTFNRDSGIREDALEILSGDLIVPKNFKFSVESKSRKDFNFWQLLEPQELSGEEKKKELDEWIEQAETDARETNKIPLLYVKINNRKPFFMFPKRLFEAKITYRDYSIMLAEDFLSYFNDDFFFEN